MNRSFWVNCADHWNGGQFKEFFSIDIFKQKPTISSFASNFRLRKFELERLAQLFDGGSNVNSVLTAVESLSPETFFNQYLFLGAILVSWVYLLANLVKIIKVCGWGPFLFARSDASSIKRRRNQRLDLMGIGRMQSKQIVKALSHTEAEFQADDLCFAHTTHFIIVTSTLHSPKQKKNR